MRLTLVSIALAVTLAVTYFDNVLDRVNAERAALMPGSPARAVSRPPAWFFDIDGEMRARYDAALLEAYPDLAEQPEDVQREVYAAFWIQTRDTDLETVDIPQKAAFLVGAITYEVGFRAAVQACAAQDMDLWKAILYGAPPSEFRCVPRGEGLSKGPELWATQDMRAARASLDKIMNSQEPAVPGSGRLYPIEVSK